VTASKKDLGAPITQGQITGIIEQGCEFEGKLTFHGTFRISGVFRGEIFTPDTLVVGEGARVQGTIEAGFVIVCGEVSGSIRAKHRVEIHRPGIFKGDIFTPSLQVDEGVIFEGSSKMSREVAQPAKSFLSAPKSP